MSFEFTRWSHVVVVAYLVVLSWRVGVLVTKRVYRPLSCGVIDYVDRKKNRQAKHHVVICHV